jgi:hypothetical protein
MVYVLTISLSGGGLSKSHKGFVQSRKLNQTFPFRSFERFYEAAYESVALQISGRTLLPPSLSETAMQYLHHARVMRKYSAWLIVLATALSPATSWGCEPIIPLTQTPWRRLVGRPAADYPIAHLAERCCDYQMLRVRIPRSPIALAQGSLVYVARQCAQHHSRRAHRGFCRLDERSFLALPLVFALGWMVQRRTARLPEANRWHHIYGGAAAMAFIGFFVVSVALYQGAESVLYARNYQTYWILKFIFVTLVACTGIVISAVLEDVRDRIPGAEVCRQSLLLHTCVPGKLHHTWRYPARCCHQNAPPAIALAPLHNKFAQCHSDGRRTRLLRVECWS